MSTLVAYFSATGTTAHVAQRLAKEIGADLYEIAPKVKYTDADLNWMDKNSRRTARPVLRSPIMMPTLRRTILSLSAFPSGGTSRPRSSIPFWKHTILREKRSSCLRRRAAAAWARRSRDSKTARPGRNSSRGKSSAGGKIPAHGRRACFERDKLAPFYAAVHKRADGFARRGKNPCKIFRDVI